MKETKVYMSELPCQCIDCQFAYSGRCQLNGEIYCIENCRRGDCPLIDIKTHDRELVAKVLEKVKKELDGDYNQYRINYILDQIQKEFEDGE